MRNAALILLVASALTLGCSPRGRTQSQNVSQENSREKKQEARAVPEPAEVIKKLRGMFLDTKPEKIGVKRSGSGPQAYGVMMETGFPEALASLISLSTGDASLYLGHGGGIIGGGAHPRVSQAARAFVAESGKHLSKMTATKEFPYPAVGRVRFYVLTLDGVFTAEAGEEELADKKHELSPLFYAGNDVLTQLRLTQEKRQ